MPLDDRQKTIRDWNSDGCLIASGPLASGRTTALAALATRSAGNGGRVLVLAPSKSMAAFRAALKAASSHLTLIAPPVARERADIDPEGNSPHNPLGVGEGIIGTDEEVAALGTWLALATDKTALHASTRLTGLFREAKEIDASLPEGLKIGSLAAIEAIAERLEKIPPVADRQEIARLIGIFGVADDARVARIHEYARLKEGTQPTPHLSPLDWREAAAYFSALDPLQPVATELSEDPAPHVDLPERIREALPDGCGLPFETFEDAEKLLSLAKSLVGFDTTRLQTVDAMQKELAALNRERTTLADAIKEDYSIDVGTVDIESLVSSTEVLSRTGLAAWGSMKERGAARSCINKIGIKGDESRGIASIMRHGNLDGRIGSKEREIERRNGASVETRASLAAAARNAGLQNGIALQWAGGVEASSIALLSALAKISIGAPEDDEATKSRRIYSIASHLRAHLHDGTNGEMAALLKRHATLAKAWESLSDTDRERLEEDFDLFAAAASSLSRLLGKGISISTENFDVWDKHELSLRRLEEIEREFDQALIPKGLQKLALKSMLFSDALEILRRQVDVENAHMGRPNFAGLPSWADERLCAALIALEEGAQAALDGLAALFEARRPKPLPVGDARPDHDCLERIVVSDGGSEFVAPHPDSAKGFSLIIVDDAEDTADGVLEWVAATNAPAAFGCLSIDGIGDALAEGIRQVRSDVIVDQISLVERYAPLHAVARTTRRETKSVRDASEAAAMLFTHFLKKALDDDGDTGRIGVFVDVEWKTPFGSALAAADTGGEALTAYLAAGREAPALEFWPEMGTHVDTAIVLAEDEDCAEMAISLAGRRAYVFKTGQWTAIEANSP